MQKKKLPLMTLVAAMAVLVSCAPQATAAPTTTPETVGPPPQMRVASATPIPNRPKNIVVDGLGDDWVGNALVIEDSPQDIPDPQYMNITKLSMVSIERSLYIKMDVAYPEAIYSAVQFHLNDLRSYAMGKHLVFFWRAGTDFFEVSDITDMAHPRNLGITHYSTIAFDQVLEVRIDNRDLEEPENLALTSIRLKYDNICKPSPEKYGDDVRVSEVYNVPIGEVFEGGEAGETIPPSAEPNVTEITVDGLADDWTNRQLVFACPEGDVEEGFIDLTDGYAFVNQNALYFMVETTDPDARVEAFYIRVSSGGTETGFVWRPSDPAAGLPQNSTLSLGEVFEGRIDLSDIGFSPEDLLLTIYAYYYPGGERVLIDIWMGGKVPVVNEVDP